MSLIMGMSMHRQMHRRHEDELRTRFERIQTHGVAELNLRELNLWFGVKALYAPVDDLWPALCNYMSETTTRDTMAGVFGDNIVLIQASGIHSGGMWKTIYDRAWEASNPPMEKA